MNPVISVKLSKFGFTTTFLKFNSKTKMNRIESNINPWKVNLYLIFTRINIFNLSIYLACLSVCLFVSNKRQNGWTDRAQFFCGTSRDPREGLWKLKISNICLHQNSIVIKFLKILKIREIFCENPRIIFILFYDVYTKRTCSQLI